VTTLEKEAELAPDSPGVIDSLETDLVKSLGTSNTTRVVLDKDDRTIATNNPCENQGQLALDKILPLTSL